MSPRNKVIILGALLVFLGILAHLQLGRSKQPARDKNAPPPPATTTAPARDSPATTTAPASAGTEANPADSAQDSGPSAADLRELADWFDLPGTASAVIARGSAPVFGLAVRTVLPAPDAPSQEPAQIPWMTEPGKLDGIVKVGDGPSRALFQGKLYQIGERVRGTTFTITAVDDDSVTLKSEDHVIRRFWHD